MTTMKIFNKQKTTIKWDIPENSNYLDGPDSMKSKIPQWYKDADKFVNGKITIPDFKTFKMCIPFLDSLTTGFCMTLPADLYVEQMINDEGEPDIKISWLCKNPPLIERVGDEVKGMPKPKEYSPRSFAWRTHISFELPKGYSCIFTHPLNRLDLPFITLSGVIDADYEFPPGNVPFLIRKDFSGIIPKGTPIAQIIPFKREEWTLSREVGLSKKALENGEKSFLVMWGWYKKNQWKRKTYQNEK